MEQNKEKLSLVVSSSPHVHDGASIQKIMCQVALCLIPSAAAGIYFFGLPAVKIILTCIVSCVVFEAIWNKIMKQPLTVKDCSAALTGLILALNMPPDVPAYICIAGAFIAIIIAKQVYGGLGQNPFNPAAVARVVLLVGFTWPMTSKWLQPMHYLCSSPAAVASATPLTAAKLASGNFDQVQALQTPEMYRDLFFGNISGSLGETSALALLIGFFGLLCFRLIRWQIPVAVITAVAVFTWIVNAVAPEITPGPLYHILSGAVLLGAFFMATDTVTSPVTIRGCVIFGTGIGVITSVIRIWGAYPEGMSFAIVIMNALVPLIDRCCYTRPFGWVPYRRGGR